MNEKINFYTLASVLTATPGDNGILFTPVQLEYLNYCVETDLTKEEIAVLEDNEKNWVLTIEGQHAIQKLRKNPRLMFILELGEHTVKDLIDTIALIATGAYMGEVKHDKETDSYYLSFTAIGDDFIKSVPEDEDDDRFNHATIEFLKAYIPSGTPRRYEGIYIDQHDQMIDDIYLEILSESIVDTSITNIQDAIEHHGDRIWLELPDEKRKTITKNDRITNDELLQFYLRTDESDLIALFDKELLDSIERYFIFWLGDNFEDYSDESEF